MIHFETDFFTQQTPGLRPDAVCYLSSESLFQLQGKRANPLAIGPAREEPDAGGGRHGRVPAADGGGRAPEDTNGGRFKLTPGLCNGSRICVQCISVGVVIKMTHISMVLFYCATVPLWMVPHSFFAGSMTLPTKSGIRFFLSLITNRKGRSMSRLAVLGVIWRGWSN